MIQLLFYVFGCELLHELHITSETAGIFETRILIKS
jgi:hypothetical protein